MADLTVTGVVTEVREAHRFDVDALTKWLTGRLPGAEHGLRLHQFEGGQSNPTYLIETVVDGTRWVLRKKPKGELLASAHMVEREARIMKALHGSAVPVPDIPIVCDDPSIIGTPFFLMSYVHGRILRDPALPGVSPADRRAINLAAVDTMAALHDVDWAARDLATYGKPSAFVSRQVSLWTKQYIAAKTRPVPAMDRLIEWLPKNIPAEPKTTIVHGDVRLDNMVVHPTEPRILAVLDWELSTLGDPFTDVAYFCMPYHVQHGGVGLRGLIGLDLAALGIPTEDEVLAAYCEKRAVPVPSREVFRFYVAFGMFRLAAIVAGIDSRLRQGNASSERANEIASQLEAFADGALRVAEQADT